MLYLNPPFPFINGVALFGDHEDPLQFYFMPTAPKLTLLDDPASGRKIPAIQLIKYRGKAGTGGFLNFDCNIGLSQEEIDDLKEELKRQLHLAKTPNLSPLPVVDGTVKLMLLDKQTGDAPGSPASPPSPGGSPPPSGPNDTTDVTDKPKIDFVNEILQAAKPALYGNNQATFSVQLSQYGVTVLEQALQGIMSPIGIVYSLDYLALRPAYSIRLDIDWNRVQHHMDESFGVDSIFTSVEIDKAIDKLKDDRAIVFEVDTFVPEGEDTKEIIASRDQAEAEVRDMITNAFFEPSLNPEKETKDGWDKAEHLMKTASAVGVTGGWAALGSFSYKKVDYTRIDQKSLNVRMSERTTVKRTIYPQGHLSGLWRPLQDQGATASDFIIEVDLDDPWFQRRRVKAISRADFENDSIASLNVHLAYGDQQPQNLILEPGHLTESVEWNSQFDDQGRPQPNITTRYTVNFKNVDNSERPLSLTSADLPIDVENLEIFPRTLYAISPVTILALSFPWDRYPVVEVRTRYLDEENNIRQEDSFLLNEKEHEFTWNMFLINPQRQSFEYKLIYRAANFNDIEMPWVATSDERVIVRDPQPNKRTLAIVPNVRWTEVDRVFVDVSYEDSDNEIFAAQSFEFNEKNTATQTFSVSLANPKRRLVTFETTIIRKDSQVITVPRSFTLEPRLIIQSDMKGHKYITVRPQQVDFSLKKIRTLTVEIRYVDDVANLSFEDIFTFAAPEQEASFDFHYVDASRQDYEYQITYRFINGMVKTMEWKRDSVESLELPVG